MKPISDDELRLALEGLRPQPRPSFAAELDARVAAGFPRRSLLPGLAPILEWMRSLKPRNFMVPAGGLALAAVVALGVALGQAGGGSDDAALDTTASAEEEVSKGGPLSLIENFGEAEGDKEAGGAATAERALKSGSSTFESEAPVGTTAAQQSAPALVPLSAGVASQPRAIERSSQLTLGTEPENVGRASSEVFDVVHTYRGIVLSSRTSDGSAAHAEARFELLIPSGKVGDAMADFSRIAEVRSRHEATNDITAPTVSAAEHLEDSRARVDSLLGQLADAETEGEREAVERELREERSRAAALQASLDNLERRASLSRVSLRIVGGEGISVDGGGAWGIGDALEDAGDVLGVIAAVTLLALAVLGPIALIALLIWFVRRTYLRRARRTALS